MPDLITMGVAWFMAWLFGVAAAHKARQVDHYRRLMGKYLFDAPVGAVMVWLVAVIELAVALALLLPQWRQAGLLAAAALLIAYAGLMGLQLARGRADMKCGCAGPASEVTISSALVLRNLVAAGLALVALAPAVSVASGLAGIGMALFTAGFLSLIYLAVEQLIANSQQMLGER